MEVRLPFAGLPPWVDTPETDIKATAEEAIETHNEIAYGNDLIIYTDGSGIDSNIGAAAYNMWRAKERKAYLGTDKQHTVYSAELYGILMALEMAKEDDTRRKVHIFTDNQAAIRASHRPKNQSGQYIVK